jgi:hypothetical protein
MTAPALPKLATVSAAKQRRPNWKTGQNAHTPLLLTMAPLVLRAAVRTARLLRGWSPAQQPNRTTASAHFGPPCARSRWDRARSRGEATNRSARCLQTVSVFAGATDLRQLPSSGRPQPLRGRSSACNEGPSDKLPSWPLLRATCSVAAGRLRPQPEQGQGGKLWPETGPRGPKCVPKNGVKKRTLFWGPQSSNAR